MRLEEYLKVCIEYRGARQPIGNSRWICFRTTTDGIDRSAISLGIKAKFVNWDYKNYNRVADFAFIKKPTIRFSNTKL